MIYDFPGLVRVVFEPEFAKMGIKAPHEALYLNGYKPKLIGWDRHPATYLSTIPVIEMALVVPDAGEVRLGDAALGKTAMSSTVKLKLYTNNISPNEPDTRTTYTEASGNGYSEKAITNANWSTVTTTGTTESTYPQVDIDFTGALGDVYGYLFCDATAGTLMWAERFPTAPYNIANNGDRISIIPKIQFS